MKLSIDAARDLIAEAFVAAGTAERSALLVAQALVAAERDGQKGHGFSRIPSYLAQVKSGKVDGQAQPTASSVGDALVSIDAACGFAYPAIDLAIAELQRLTASTGIAGAMIHRSHHSGQLAAHVERLAKAGLIAIMVGNTPEAMAPWGGSKALFGTNPIAFAAPRAGGQPPLLIDLSLSKVARGKVMAAKQKCEPIPEGWALDRDGNPTTDADAALEGTMVPMGDAKGAALALMVEVLAASLTGANHSYEASSFFSADGDSPGVGQLIIAIQPQSGFAARLEELVTAIEGQDGARLPGTKRFEGRKAQELEMPDEIYALLTV